MISIFSLRYLGFAILYFNEIQKKSSSDLLEFHREAHLIVLPLLKLSGRSSIDCFSLLIESSSGKKVVFIEASFVSKFNHTELVLFLK